MVNGRQKRHSFHSLFSKICNAFRSPLTVSIDKIAYSIYTVWKIYSHQQSNHIHTYKSSNTTFKSICKATTINHSLQIRLFCLITINNNKLLW